MKIKKKVQSMKYVAFLDILGFKNKLAKLKQGEAEKYISDFSRTIYDIWEKQNFNLINGYIVSDSVIIYTENVLTFTCSRPKNLLCFDLTALYHCVL